ncbi:hypothetical protein KRM28CT15_04060 [Krasilnikovia sp. M28-CT-15]
MSAPSPVDAAGSGRSNGVRPSLSSDFLYCYVLSAGVGTPRDFVAPDTYDGTVTASSGTLNLTSAPPRSVRPEHVSPRGTAVLNFPFNYEVLVVLSFTCVVLFVPGGAVELLALLLRLGGAVSSASLSFLRSQPEKP